MIHNMGAGITPRVGPVDRQAGSSCFCGLLRRPFFAHLGGQCLRQPQPVPALRSPAALAATIKPGAVGMTPSLEPVKGGFQNSRALFGSPYDEDHNILKSILGTPIFGDSHIPHTWKEPRATIQPPDEKEDKRALAQIRAIDTPPYCDIWPHALHKLK